MTSFKENWSDLKTKLKCIQLYLFFSVYNNNNNVLQSMYNYYYAHYCTYAFREGQLKKTKPAAVQKKKMKESSYTQNKLSATTVAMAALCTCSTPIQTHIPYPVLLVFIPPSLDWPLETRTRKHSTHFLGFVGIVIITALVGVAFLLLSYLQKRGYTIWDWSWSWSWQWLARQGLCSKQADTRTTTHRLSKRLLGCRLSWFFRVLRLDSSKEAKELI